MIPCINYILSCVNRGIRCHSLSFVVIRGDSLSIVVFRVSFVAFYRVSFVATPCFNRGQAVVKGLSRFTTTLLIIVVVTQFLQFNLQ